jgi:dihydroorotate dehydrogenase
MLYRSLLRPILFRLPAETAHELALQSLSLPFAARLINRVSPDDSKTLSNTAIERFSLRFKNPVGLAAGFDKNGIALPALAALGFGFIEAGTVTYHPQPGNQRPRLFRLPADHALINRAGFNNEGAIAFARRVGNSHPACPLGVSIGKSKVTPLEDAIDDYLASFDAVFPVADYVAVNVSSPNTPGLRELQRADQLERLLAALNERNTELAVRRHRSSTIPLLVKLAPDLQNAELELIVDVACRQGIAGLIATNTTIDRGNLVTPADTVRKFGEGGLSGAPLRKRSTNIIAYLYKLTKGTMPLIGVGGIFNAVDAWEKICAGASLVQVYTGLIYEGPWIVQKINQGLAQMIAQHGLRSLDEAVGSHAAEFV